MNNIRNEFSDRRQNFSDKSSILILICLVAMSLLANVMFKDNSADSKEITEIRFPAYETEYQEINKAMPFVVNVTLPGEWQLSMDGSTEKFPQVKLYNPYYIYNGDECIGYIGFNTFTPPAEEPEDAMSYHQHVWPVMDGGSMLLNEYTLVRLTDKFEAAYCKLSDTQTASDAVLCYNKNIHNMVGIVLAEGVADQATLLRICLSLSFSVM